jgi:hypothetical protein
MRATTTVAHNLGSPYRVIPDPQPVPGTDACPMDPRATAIRLEVWLDGESPIGRAYDEQGGSRAFAGWTSLVATIDDLLTGAGQGSDNGPSNGRFGS